MGGAAWGQVEPIRSELNKNIKQFCVEQKIGSEVQKERENEQDNEHDKIIQYFPQYGKGHICPAQQPFIWIARVREGWATKKHKKQVIHMVM
jgi:hypothetical protein